MEVKTKYMILSSIQNGKNIVIFILRLNNIEPKDQEYAQVYKYKGKKVKCCFKKLNCHYHS